MATIEAIKQDHDKMRELAENIMQTEGNSEQRRELFKQFKKELRSHSDAEEQTLYAAMMRKDKSQKQIRHSTTEHEEAAELLEKLEDTEMSSSSWLSTFSKLKEELEHHMQEEETEVFNKAQKVLDEKNLQKVEEQFSEKKEEKLTSAR